VIWIYSQDGQLVHTQSAQDRFQLKFTASKGCVEITTSTQFQQVGDARPLGFLIYELLVDDEPIDIGRPMLPDQVKLPDDQRFTVLSNACAKTRESRRINLTSIRGPDSPGMEKYVGRRTREYDLVVTHNNVFRPAVIAVKEANDAGVPVVSIPHAHLDDDFYHFPDVHKCVLDSDLVLAAPRVTCEFYRQMGANVSYLPAGIDSREEFNDDDVKAFEDVCSVDQPFILVLGRKAQAKGYRIVIDTVEHLSKNEDIHLVMIGPDDDNQPVDSPRVSYLGAQPRSVVRGALMSCKALVNMSSSESFGIVLLEAWMAGKPVIVNRACAAFHDLATDNHNALMVDDMLSLKKAITQLLSDQQLCDQLAKNGQEILPDYDWSHVGSLFVKSCNELTTSSYSTADKT
jgi:glycosyltransferase involved in cell wall biosynthesis